MVSKSKTVMSKHWNWTFFYYDKILCTPSVAIYGGLYQANYKNYKGFLIYLKTSFICDQAEVSSSSGLGMTKVWSETVILKNDENGWPLVSEI